jgi:hypothetical protein
MMSAAGVGVFATPQDLNSFAKGSLAQAFGIEIGSDVEDEVRDEPQLAIRVERSSEGDAVGSDAEAETPNFPAEPAAVPEAEGRRLPPLQAPALAQELGRSRSGRRERRS